MTRSQLRSSIRWESVIIALQGHGALLARARDFGPALDALRMASRIDLDDLTGTTASGLHLATMGSLWQALVFGFAGMRPHRGRLVIDPRLPTSWGALEIRVKFHGAPVQLRKQQGTLLVQAGAPVPLTLDGISFTAGPAPLEFRRRGARWEAAA